jgi:hypothetical protein
MYLASLTELRKFRKNWRKLWCVYGQSFFLDAQAFPYRLGLKSKVYLSQSSKLVSKIRLWTSKTVATWHIYCCQLQKLTYILQVLVTGKPEHYVLVNSNWCTPFPNKTSWSVVVSAACELMVVFAVVVYLVGAVNKFDSGLLKWNLTNGDQWKPVEVVIKIRLWKAQYIFSRVRGRTYTVKLKVVFVSRQRMLWMWALVKRFWKHSGLTWATTGQWKTTSYKVKCWGSTTKSDFLIKLPTAQRRHCHVKCFTFCLGSGVRWPITTASSSDLRY